MGRGGRLLPGKNLKKNRRKTKPGQSTLPKSTEKGWRAREEGCWGSVEQSSPGTALPAGGSECQWTGHYAEPCEGDNE